MPVGQPIPTVQRYTAMILTSDPASGTIEAALKGADARQITIVSIPTAFRWPVAGETWVVRQENGSWYLDGVVPDPSLPTTINSVAPGDVVLNSPTGNVHVLGSEDGSTDFTFNGGDLFGNLSAVVSGGSGPITIGGNEVNTGQFLQSSTGTDPTQALNGFPASPIDMVGLHTAHAFSDNASGTTWASTAAITSSGTRDAIAIGGLAVGQHVWASNLMAKTNTPSGIAYGLEIDTGYSGSSGLASAVGLLVSGQFGASGGTNTGGAIRVNALANSSFTTGLEFRSNNGGQPVISSGSVITDDSGVSVSTGEFLAVTGSYQYALNIGNATTTTAAIRAAVNSGSTASSIGLLLFSRGGFANAGTGIQFQATDASSTIANGILFHLSAGNQPVASTGTLIKADGGTYGVGIDLSGATFTTSPLKLPATSAPGVTTGYTTGTSTAVTIDGKFTGNVGATAYTLADLVAALKDQGVITK